MPYIPQIERLPRCILAGQLKSIFSEELMEYNEFFVNGMRLLGAGMAMLGAIGAGVGVGIAASGGVQAMGRNPDAAPIIQTNMILGMAFAEAVAIYALAVALIIVFAA